MSHTLKTVDYMGTTLVKLILLLIVGGFVLFILATSIKAVQSDLTTFIVCLFGGAIISFLLWGILNGLIKLCDCILAWDEKQKWKRLNK